MKKPADLWSETRGSRPHSVRVGENAAKGLDVYLTYYVAGARKMEKTDVGGIRDSRGRIIRSKQQDARNEADAKIEELKTGRLRKRSGPLTLAEGVALAFSVSGCYPLDPAADVHTRKSRGWANEFIRLLGGGDTLWEDVTPGMVRSVWRKVEKQTRAQGGGHELATKIVLTLFRIAGWLEEEYPDDRFPRAIKRWREELRDHWKKVRGTEMERHRPRFTDAEVGALYRARLQADPRVRVALALGGELRGGQVIRAMRSYCEDVHGEVVSIRIPSASRRKRIPPLPLSEFERSELRHAMTEGYLSELEAAYRAGDIPDYALFPSGRLAAGKAVIARAAQHMWDTTLIGMVHDLERIAGVKPEKGRAWHGIRRAFSDMYEPLTTDERVKDQLGGWAPGSDMRRSTYEEQEAAGVLADASKLRGKVKQALADGNQVGG
jgi:hypothetical protein